MPRLPPPKPPRRSTSLIVCFMPDDDKYDLARLLIDSVQQRFTSLAEAEERERDKIRRRLEEYTSGRVKGIPGAEALADVRATLAEYRALRAKV